MRAPAHREVVVGGRDDREGRRLAPRARLIQRLRGERRMQQIPLGALARLSSSKLDLRQCPAMCIKRYPHLAHATMHVVKTQ